MVEGKPENHTFASDCDLPFGIGFQGEFLCTRKNPGPLMRDSPQPEMVKKAIARDAVLDAHAAAVGMMFDLGNRFGRENENDLPVSLHGS